MKRKIAPDIDSLMWTVAERGDSAAIADFENRFPDLKYELARRIWTVKALKDAKPRSVGHDEIPHFFPTEENRPNRLVWIAAALVLISFGVASYSATKNMIQNHWDNVTAVADPLPASPEPEPSSSQYAMVPLEPQNQVRTVNRVPEYLEPVDLELEGVSLTTALQAIAQESGLSLEIGPGLEDPLIVAHYNNMTGLHIMQELGRHYGFTAFDQGEGAVLVIPAVQSDDEPSMAESELYASDTYNPLVQEFTPLLSVD